MMRKMDRPPKHFELVQSHTGPVWRPIIAEDSPMLQAECIMLRATGATVITFSPKPKRGENPVLGFLKVWGGALLLVIFGGPLLCALLGGIFLPGSAPFEHLALLGLAILLAATFGITWLQRRLWGFGGK